MSTPREQGMEALKEGNLDKAVDFLARAVLADDNDIEAKALLGVAYSQKGLHTQAKRALMTAVEREPNNQNYRFNLGVVMERAGDPAGAAVAYRDLLQLNPQHPQARAKLQAMGPAAMSAQRPAGMPPPPGGGAPPPSNLPPPPGMGAPPGYGAPPMSAPPRYGAPPGGAPPGYGAPPMGAPPMGTPPGYGPPGGAPPPPMHGGPPMGAPPIGGPPMGAPPIGAPPMGAPPMGAPPGYGAPPAGAPPGYGPPSMGMGMGGSMPAPPGTMQCPSCGQFPRVGMLCEFCNSPLPPPPKHSPTPPPTYGPPPGMGGRPAPMNYGGARSEDDFNIGDGFQSWGRVLISPVAFFQETSAFDGIKGPASFVMAFAIVNHVLGIVLGLIAGQGLNFRFGGLFYGWVCQFAFFMICYFIWGGIVHLACKIVGGQSDYSGSFRASTFGSAPCTVMILIAASIMMLGMKNNPSLLGRRLAPVTPYASVREAPASAGLIDGPGAPALHAPLLQISPGAPPSPGGVSGRPDPSQVLSRLWTIFALPMVLVLVGYIWSLALTGIGIAQIHQVGTGAAVGAVLIAVILNIILWIGLFFLLGAAFASMFAALSSTMHR